MRLPSTLSNAIDQIARAALGKDWGLYAGLLQHWTEIVGQDYAKSTTPVKISFPRGKKTDEKWTGGRRGGGTLTIKLPQGLAMEFGFKTDQIRARINGFFGYDAIERIAFETYYPTDDKPYAPPPLPLSPAQEADLAQNTKDIEDEELRQALQNLGESVLTRGEKS